MEIFVFLLYNILGDVMVITSLDNERIKNYIKLKDKKYRDETGLFIVEGEHLVLEAYRAGILKEIILEEDIVIPIDVPKVYVTKEIIKKISTVLSPQSMYGVCYKVPEGKIGDKVLILDGLQDPGNVGTIIRSAKAFDVDTIVLSPTTVDLYNSKVLRATQGMAFHMNIVRTDIKDMILTLKEKEVPIYVTKVEYGEDVRLLSDKDKVKYALVIGNEGNGVSREIQDMADKFIYIDMNSKVESLNVSIATSILLYELGR